MAFSAGQAPKIGGNNYNRIDLDRRGIEEGIGTMGWGGVQGQWGAQQQDWLRQAESGDSSVAQQQMKAGLGQVQRQAAGQAMASGNPLAARAAIQSSGQAGMDAVTQSAALRAQEMQAAQQQMAQYYGQLTGGYMDAAQMQMQQDMAQAGLEQEQTKMRLDQEAAERAFGMDMAKMGMSAAGGLAMSDESSKTPAPMETPADRQAKFGGRLKEIADSLGKVGDTAGSLSRPVRNLGGAADDGLTEQERMLRQAAAGQLQGSRADDAMAKFAPDPNEPDAIGRMAAQQARGAGYGMQSPAGGGGYALIGDAPGGTAQGAAPGRWDPGVQTIRSSDGRVMSTTGDPSATWDPAVEDMFGRPIGGARQPEPMRIPGDTGAMGATWPGASSADLAPLGVPRGAAPVDPGGLELSRLRAAAPPVTTPSPTVDQMRAAVGGQAIPATSSGVAPQPGGWPGASSADLSLVPGYIASGMEMKGPPASGMENKRPAGGGGAYSDVSLKRARSAAIAGDQDALARALGVERDVLSRPVGSSLDSEMARQLSDAERMREEYRAQGAMDHREAADETMRGMPGYTYEYRPEARERLDLPGGTRYGIMAQDLEQTPIGRTMVRDTPDGKMIDRDAATTGGLALIGRLGERSDEAEVRDALLARRLEEIERATRRGF